MVIKVSHLFISKILEMEGPNKETLFWIYSFLNGLTTPEETVIYIFPSFPSLLDLFSVGSSWCFRAKVMKFPSVSNSFSQQESEPLRQPGQKTWILGSCVGGAGCARKFSFWNRLDWQ